MATTTPDALHVWLGRRVAALRLAANPKPLTQQELANRSRGRISRSTLANIERGAQGIAFAQLMVLAEALDVEPRDLVPSRAELSGQSETIEQKLGAQSKGDRRWLESIRTAAIDERGGRNA